MTGTPSPPAGWYPDPGGTTQLRRWDGAAWTDEVRAVLERSGEAAAGTHAVSEGVAEATRLDLHAAIDDDRPAAVPMPAVVFSPGLGELPAAGAPPVAALPSAPPVPEDRTGTKRQRPRRRESTNVIVGVVLLAFAGVGAFEVASGGSTGKNSAAAGFAAGPTTTLPTATASAGGCDAGQPDAAALVDVLALSGLALVANASTPTTAAANGVIVPAGPSHVTPPTVPAPPGTCSSTTFHDERGQSLDVITVYPTAAAASEHTRQLSARTSAITVGPVVIRLEPAVARLALQYRAVITRALPASLAPATTAASGG
jgi:hypothetical protein